MPTMPTLSFEDLIPPANRGTGVASRGGMFDDLIPEANRVEPNVGGRPLGASPMDFAMDSTAVSEASRQRPALAAHAIGPQPTMGQSLLESEHNNLLAARQRTDPAVYDGEKALRKKLGVIIPEYSDMGQVPPNSYVNSQNKLVQVDPNRQVVLIDPQSNQPTVFERNFDAEGTDVTEEPMWKSLGRTVLPGFVTGPVAGPARMTSRIPQHAPPGASGVAMAAARAESAAQDLLSFERAGVPVFAPAFAGNAGRATAKGLADTWGVGAPVQNALENTYAGLSAATTRLADDISPVSSIDQAGATLQRGLDRFQTSGVRDIEPGVLAGVEVRAAPGFVGPVPGIQPRAPIQPQQVMSQGAQQRAAAAAPIRTQNAGGVAETSRGVPVPSARPLDQTIIARRAVDDMTDAEIAALTRAPAGETSFAVRSEALYERAQRQLPAQMRANDTANPQMLQATNTRNAVNALRAEQERTRIPGGVVNGRFTGLADRVQTNVTLPTLRAMRTAIGREMSNFNYGEMGLDRTQLNRLYASISRDIEIAYQDIANRAHIASRLSNNAPDYVRPEVARAADRALYEFRRADRYFRNGMQRMDSFLSVVDAKNPEMAARRLVESALSGGKGDIGLFRNAMAALRPEERSQFASLVLRKMGAPVPSARGVAQEVGFSPSTFTTNHRKMDQRALEMLFPGEHGRAINDLVRIADRMANVESFANTSNSGRMGVNVGGLMTGIGSAATGGWPGVLAAIGGGAGLSYMLSRPAYARWLVRYAQLKSVSAQRASRSLDVAANGARSGLRGVDAAIVSHVNKLAQATQRDPDLLGVYHSVATEEGILQGRGNERGPERDIRMEDRQNNPESQLHRGNGTSGQPRAELRSYTPSPSENAAFYTRQGAEALGIPASQAERIGSGASALVSAFTPADDIADAFETGSAASAAAAGLSFIPGFRGGKKAAEVALTKVRNELAELEAEAARLFGEARTARIMGPNPVPDIPGREIPTDTLLQSAERQKQKLQEAIEGRRTELAARPQPPTSVPATTSDQQRALERSIDNNPFVQAVPGRQGFPRKEEQKKLVREFFESGETLPAAPWGRDAVSDVKHALASAHARGKAVSAQDASAIETAAKKASKADDAIRELRMFAEATPNGTKESQDRLLKAETEAKHWQKQYNALWRKLFGED